MGVFEAVEREVGDDAGSPLGAMALSLAQELDSPENGGTSKSLINKELRETLAALRALKPAKPEEDELAKLRDRRSTRLAGGAASANPSRS